MFGKRVLKLGSFFFATVLSINTVIATSTEPSIEMQPCGYLNELIDRALNANLYNKRYWHILLHYNRSFRGLVSDIDDPAFFLSPSGKRQPKVELIATLKAFFEDPKTGEEHPRCRFVARYHWLKLQLDIDEAQLPAIECSQFDTLMQQFIPQQATLVFPAAYMNNPASMFGHTLLNIKSAEESSLLSKSINYSARTPVQNGIVFAFKGVFGFYKGYYEIFPYYARIQLYNDINQRDIWEYELNLSQTEIEQMVRHMWELREIYSKYYFFNENCSYNLLYLLDAARPSMNLAGKFKTYVIPLDTIRAMVVAGLIDTVHYRPSKATKIHHIMGLLPGKLNKLALAIGKLQTQADTVVSMELTDQNRRYVLDLATEFLQYRYVKKEVTKERYQKSFLKILGARSQIPEFVGADYAIPSPASPETGHRTKRLRLGGEFDDGRFYTTVGLRPAYHDLLDSDVGYVGGSEIEFFNVDLRFDPTDEKFELKRFIALSIVALSSRDLFFKPISWKLRAGIAKARLRDDKKHHEFFLTTGQGLSWSFRERVRAYVVPEVELLVSRNLNPDYALGVGGTAGILATISERWKMHLFGRGLAFEVGDIHSTIELNVDNRLKLTANTALGFTVIRERTFNLYDTLLSFNINYYF